MRGRLETVWGQRGYILHAIVVLVALVLAVVRFAKGDWISGSILTALVVIEVARLAFTAWVARSNRQSPAPE